MPAFRALEESIGGLREASRGTDVANFFCPIEPRAKTAQEAPAPDSLAALARENHGDLAEKGMSPYITPRGRSGAVRLTAAPMPVMPSPASVAEQDY